VDYSDYQGNWAANYSPVSFCLCDVRRGRGSAGGVCKCESCRWKHIPALHLSLSVGLGFFPTRRGRYLCTIPRSPISWTFLCLTAFLSPGSFRARQSLAFSRNGIEGPSLRDRYSMEAVDTELANTSGEEYIQGPCKRLLATSTPVASRNKQTLSILCTSSSVFSTSGGD
jgi:hypothetical protein